MARHLPPHRPAPAHMRYLRYARSSTHSLYRCAQDVEGYKNATRHLAVGQLENARVTGLLSPATLR